jgi:hypothetical protein
MCGICRHLFCFYCCILQHTNFVIVHQRNIAIPFLRGRPSYFLMVHVYQKIAYNQKNAWNNVQCIILHLTLTASYIRQAWLQNFKLLLKREHDEVTEVSNIQKESGRSPLGQDGELSELFFLYIFQDHKGIKFLHESRLYIIHTVHNYLLSTNSYQLMHCGYSKCSYITKLCFNMFRSLLGSSSGICLKN